MATGTARVVTKKPRELTPIEIASQLINNADPNFKPDYENMDAKIAARDAGYENWRDIGGSKTARDVEFEGKYGATLSDKTSAYSQTMLDELALAKRQAAGKLGFALSSGPGTSGLAVAAENALNRQFAGLQASNRLAVDKFATDFKLNWNLNKDRWQHDEGMARMQFQQQQIMLQQQAELNSASWWEQLGGIIGFGLALPVGGGLSVAGYGLAQLRG